MPRPDFPKPYMPLTPEIISRIRENQEVYDRDPKGWERREQARKEQEREEEERLYEQQMEEEQQQESKDQCSQQSR